MPKRPYVLIVDDEAIFLKIAKAMVKRLGFPVLTAHDGIEAIALFQEHIDDIGCIVLDIYMPRMDGIETFRHLRQMHSNVQVIILSGHVDEKSREQIDPLLPVEYLHKPLSYRQFSDLLKTCLRKTDQDSQEERIGYGP